MGNSIALLFHHSITMSLPKFPYVKEEVTLFPEFGLAMFPEEAWLFSANAELKERVMASSIEMK